MEKGNLQALFFPIGLTVNCEYTDSLGKMKQLTAEVKSSAKDTLALLLNQPDSTVSLPFGKEIFVTVSQGSDPHEGSRKFVCYVVDVDPVNFPLLTVTPPIERPKLSTTQSFYCRVKLPLIYFINKIEFSGEIINLSVIRFLAVVDYNPELKPGMMLNFQMALPSKIYTNLVGEILQVHKLINNQMAVVVNFLNTLPDLQSAIIKYLFQRQRELVQSKQPVVIEPKKSTRKTASNTLLSEEQEIRNQFLFTDPKEQPEMDRIDIDRTDPEVKSSLNPKEPSVTNWGQWDKFHINGVSGGMAGEQSFQYAGFWNRGAALLLDILVLTLIGAVTTGIFIIIIMMLSHTSLIGDTWSKLLNSTRSFLTGFFIIIGFALYWVYFTTLESSGRQATFGKRWLGIAVITQSGKPISPGVAGQRALFRILSGGILFIGFIMAGFSPKKQALHDLLTRTVVIKED